MKFWGQVLGIIEMKTSNSKSNSSEEGDIVWGDGRKHHCVPILV